MAAVRLLRLQVGLAQDQTLLLLHCGVVLTNEVSLVELFLSLDRVLRRFIILRLEELEAISLVLPWLRDLNRLSRRALHRMLLLVGPGCQNQVHLLGLSVLSLLFKG